MEDRVREFDQLALHRAGTSATSVQALLNISEYSFTAPLTPIRYFVVSLANNLPVL